MNFQTVIHRLMQIGRHAMAHAHEITVAAVIEGPHITLALALAIIGILFLVFALQVALAVEAV